MNPSTPDDETGVRLRVEGVVQGVGFRWWARERAVELKVTGTVRNLPDESVEIVAFGNPDSLTAFRRLVSEGPSSAIVKRVEEAPLPVEQSAPEDFRIVR